MPNWASGTIKFRGKQKDIIDLVKEKFVSTAKVKIEENEYALELTIDDKNPYYNFYIAGTDRAFIDRKYIRVPKYGNDDDVMTVEIRDFEQAWGVVADNFAELSEQYNVDIKIFAFEMGVEFTQEVEVSDGVVVKNIETTYDDYAWDVPFATIGG